MNAYYSSLALVNNFPDFSVPGFNIEAYNNFFKTSNSIINATASDVAYPEHWGCLSIKCAFNGEEFYRTQNRVYAVIENNFLVLNEGQYYSSYIFSKNPVESFTLNFTSRFVKDVMGCYLRSDEKNMDDPFCGSIETIEFIEKLYPKDALVTPVISTIRELAKNFSLNKEIINELFYLLFEKLLMLHKEVGKEINKVTACKSSTRKELYKRLHYAKDFIDSCYASEITLHQLSLITLMNTAYFLRQFKKYFNTTPYQYLMKKRMQVAGEMMRDISLTVSDVCSAVGYEDVSSFAKLFKKSYGFSPEVYRNRIS